MFTFALPAVLLALLGSLFSGVYEGSTVTSAQYLVPSMIAAGVASATFVNLGISVAADREDGTLKRLRGAPMPAAAYFLGKVMMVLVVTVAEVVILLGVAASSFAGSERSAGAVMNLPYIALSFVSGIFYTPVSALPDGLLTAGSLFPLRRMAQGFRSVFLTAPTT